MKNYYSVKENENNPKELNKRYEWKISWNWKSKNPNQYQSEVSFHVHQSSQHFKDLIC